MINLDRFYSVMKANEIEFISGVPDTLLNDFCLGLAEEWEPKKHVLAANEGNSIALAAGYHLSTGTVPLVYMQNSGMGNAMNPLISLTDKTVYSIPVVMLIGWRGEPESGDWPQHARQGELSPVLLDSLNIPYKILDENEDATIEKLEWAVQKAKESNVPTALLVRKGVLAKKEKAGFDDTEQNYSLSREDAIRNILSNAPSDTIFVASTGRITRELHAIREELGGNHEQDFLNVGAMGHTLSIATGIAAGNPNKHVICLDGDSAAIMHLGSMPVSATHNLTNLTHIILNNGAHESVGGQQSVGQIIDFTSIARASGYRVQNSFLQTKEGIRKCISEVLCSDGPHFLEVRIKKGMRQDMPILRMLPAEEKTKFMNI